MLVIREGLTGLRRVKENPFLGLLVWTDQSAAAAGSDHLITIETHDAKPPEGSTHLSLEA